MNLNLEMLKMYAYKKELMPCVINHEINMAYSTVELLSVQWPPDLMNNEFEEPTYLIK